MPRRSRQSQGIESWLNADGTPVFLLGPDRRLLYFNRGCERLTGWTAAEVVGHICEYASEPDHAQVASLTGSLCPPPEVLAGRPASVPVYLSQKEGGGAARLIHFTPLHREDQSIASILGIAVPIGPPSRPAAPTPAQQVHAELASLRTALRQRYGVRNFLGRSEAMRRVLEQIGMAKAARAPVHLTGENGTGKEHVARIIHHESEARTRSFVPFDCRALPALELKQTLRRILEPKEGVPAAVPGLLPGTLYLAHVDQLPRDLQEMLVRAWQSDGSDAAARLPRLITAAGGDLAQAVEADALRRDFYFLVTALVIELPPLRSRPDDLEPLAQSVLEQLNRGAERQIGGFSPETWEQLREYNWPGNLDELEAVIGEARANCRSELIQPSDLPFRFRTGLDAQAVGPRTEPRVVPLEDYLARIEREQIERALSQAKQNKRRAAELLGLTRTKLYRRMEALGIADGEGDR